MKNFKIVKPYISDEKRLSYYPEYSEANCYLECAWRAGAGACGCVPWYLLRLFPRSDVCELAGNR